LGATVVRKHLVAAFTRGRPELTIVLARSGSGKTALASQIGVSELFSHRIWCDFSGQVVDSYALLEGVAAALARYSASERTEAGLAVNGGADGLTTSIAESLAALEPGPIILVLDGMRALGDLVAAENVGRIVRRIGGEPSGVLITTQGLESTRESRSRSLWIVEQRDLRLTDQEVIDVVASMSGTCANEKQALHLADVTERHIATLCILARHFASELDGADLVPVPRDLRVYLMNLAREGLDSELLDLLFAIALLRSGSIAELEFITGRDCQTSVELLYERVPLLLLQRNAGNVIGFRMHDLAAEPYCSHEFGNTIPAPRSLVARAEKCLRARGDYDRFLGILEIWETADRRASVVDELGSDLLARGRSRLLSSALASLPVAVVLEHPQLLLLKGTLERLSGDAVGAKRSVIAAENLCRCAENLELWARTRLLLARISLDLGEYAEVVKNLEELAASYSLGGDPEGHALYHSYLLAAFTQSGDMAAAEHHCEELMRVHRDCGLSPEVKAHTMFGYLWLVGAQWGQWSATVDPLTAIMNDSEVSAGARLQAQCNLAWSLVQMGHLYHAGELLSAANQLVEKRGLEWIAHNVAGTQALVLVGAGECREGLDLHQEASQGSIDLQDVISTTWSHLTGALIRRVAGDHDGSLKDAADALSGLSSQVAESSIWRTWAQAEVAASLLSLGDVGAACRALQRSRSTADTHAKHNMLRMDLIGAEIGRCSNEDKRALADALKVHSDYIVGESANWELAMYIRAFPGLLGIVASAVGVDRLPTHMLRMIFPETSKVALPMARDVLDEAPWRDLAIRLLGEEAAAALESSLTDKPLVTVHLFGGLEIITPQGIVSDKTWRKRKARLLFLMLVARQGRDVPRDVLLENLWPEMDEARAKNNFYVIWSAMKRVLMSGEPTPNACPYVEHSAGVCRIVRPLVWSDLDEFDSAMVDLEAAERINDVDAGLAVARRLHEMYRAELLPSEFYNDWFRPTRDRCRVLFGDAMLRVSRLCRQAEDSQSALQLVRFGLEHDPWREDLYQATLRYQIDTGQRSGAIETYMTCRTRLAEDLGIDPSSETQRLYEEVIAMEDKPDDD